MQFLLADAETPSSLRWIVAHARENLRTVRQVIPRAAWRLVNELATFVEEQAAGRLAPGAAPGRCSTGCSATASRSPGSWPAACAATTPTSSSALGTHLERADMTTRVLDVRAAGLVSAATEVEGGGGGDPGTVQLYEDLQWLGVLRSVLAQHAFRRSTSEPVAADAVVRFLLLDDRYPRSVAFCLDQVAEGLGRLPRARRAGRCVPRRPAAAGHRGVHPHLERGRSSTTSPTSCNWRWALSTAPCAAPTSSPPARPP